MSLSKYNLTGRYLEEANRIIAFEITVYSSLLLMIGVFIGVVVASIMGFL